MAMKHHLFGIAGMKNAAEERMLPGHHYQEINFVAVFKLKKTGCHI
jgi:hypothetical protein